VFDNNIGLTTWNKIILADIIVANVWMVTAYLAKEGPLIMVDPSANVIISTSNASLYGTIRAFTFIVIAANAVWSLLNLPSTITFKTAVTLRFTVEITLLTALVTIIPRHVAPAFHVVLLASVGTIMAYIAGRDFILGNCQILSTLALAANLLSVGPMLTLSNAVPVYTEYFIAAALTMQIAAFGILAAY
jgi:hypothetical protein